MVVGKVMDELFTDNGVSLRGGALQIKSHGRPRTVTLGQLKENSSHPIFSVQSLNNLQATKGFSDNQTLEIGKFLRYEGGRNIVEANLKQKIKERNHSLEEFFIVQQYSMKKKLKKNDNKPESLNKDNSIMEFQRDGVMVKDLKLGQIWLCNTGDWTLTI